jgi:hypothetical protein
MRIIGTSLLAFVLSGTAGGLVTILLAVITGAEEEYIVAFMASALLTILVTIVLFVAQFFTNARAAVNLGALGLLALLVLGGVGLVALTLSQPSSSSVWSSDMPVVAGLILPGIATILVNWLVVRTLIRQPTANPGLEGQPI